MLVRGEHSVLLPAPGGGKLAERGWPPITRLQLQIKGQHRPK
jgi:hypothetical protein